MNAVEFQTTVHKGVITLPGAEVHSFAQELRGTLYLEEQELNFKLQKINKEINSLKRKLVSLDKQKNELIEIQKRANP